MINYMVYNFIYNGLTIKIKNNFTNYTAQFVKWTDDPGVATFGCSDGKQRDIPTCAIVNFKTTDYPLQKIPEHRLEERDNIGFIIGKPCSSL